MPDLPRFGYARVNRGDVLERYFELTFEGKETICAADVNDDARGSDLDLGHRCQGTSTAIRPAASVLETLAPAERIEGVLHDGFTITRGKIVAIDMVADPERLDQLDVAILAD